jgi:EAL domain-containing protein (putative c-di-GMP-specific phosphodiesterase class I)/ActR/RegA family two-component response regulator
VHSSTTVLLIDDDALILDALHSVLRRKGFVVTTASRGEAALAILQEKIVDVIVSDISMPNMTGVELLRAVRERDAEVPVLLMTGAPSVDSAISAVELGAFRYLTKPVAPATLIESVERAARLGALARLKRQALALMGGADGRLGDQLALDVRFTAALSQSFNAYQPIVDYSARSVFGYEALLRTDEPTMRNPAVFIEAAERLDRLTELGRANRARVARDSASAPDGVKLFINLHSSDLSDDELYAPGSALSAIASRVVLEVTERASLHGVTNLSARIQSLKAMGFEVAIDDLGAGYAGLTSFTQLDPQVTKLDMSLIRDVDADPRRQEIIRSMTALCGQLGMLVVAEGVETPAERDMLVSLGANLFQGYLFAKPQRGFVAPVW